MLYITEISTRLGRFTARFSERGLVGLEFPSAHLRQRTDAATPLPAAIHRWHKRTSVVLREALSGRAFRELPPLDWSGATEFQRQVWAALRRIPSGQTQTYASVAVAIGRPRAARAVGAACGANPVPVLVPCHRVTAANGALGGFSGGLNWKRRLLAQEGTLPRSEVSVS